MKAEDKVNCHKSMSTHTITIILYNPTWLVSHLNEHTHSNLDTMVTILLKCWTGNTKYITENFIKLASSPQSTQTSTKARNAKEVTSEPHPYDTHNMQALAPPITQVINSLMLENGNRSLTVVLMVVLCKSLLVALRALTSTSHMELQVHA